MGGGGGGCPWFRIHGELVMFCLSFRPNPFGDSAPLHLFWETFLKTSLLPLKQEMYNVHSLPLTCTLYIKYNKRTPSFIVHVGRKSGFGWISMLAWYPRSFRNQPDCDGAEGGRLHPAGLRVKPSLANLNITKNAAQ